MESDATQTTLEVSIDPDTQAMLIRARDLDPEAWASPLHDHLAKRRSESMRMAYAEFKACPGAGSGADRHQ